MLQRSIAWVSVVVTAGLMPGVALAERATATPSASSKPSAELNRLEPDQVSTVDGAVKPFAPDAPDQLKIPSRLAPYLDPSIHPDLRFDPGKAPSDSDVQDAQTVRLEIRLSKRQVSVYRGDTLVKSYAIAIGRPGWETPVGTYAVQQMIKNPTWIHPLEKGVVIPGGDPENPLGHYWIGFWTNGKNWIGFHGTPTPRSVGKAASHGCIRMYNQDVEELFKQVKLGTVVTVVK